MRNYLDGTSDNIVAATISTKPNTIKRLLAMFMKNPLRTLTGHEKLCRSHAIPCTKFTNYPE